MRNSSLIRAPLVVALALLAGCNLPQWQHGGSVHTSAAGQFSVRPPTGWMFLENPRTGSLVVTVDGVTLQRAGIGWSELKQPLPFSKRTLTANLTPLELAEAVADDMRADRDLHELQVTETAPATIGGQPGFKLTLHFHTEDGLGFNEAIYGCIRGERLYLLHFAAPSRHYFERDAAGFDEMVRSLTFKPESGTGGPAVSWRRRPADERRLAVN